MTVTIEPKQDLVECFRREFRGWVVAHNNYKGFEADPEKLLADLEARIPNAILQDVGDGLARNYFCTELPPGRGYTVRETDRSGGNGHYMVSHWGEGKIAPCWELYVQLADYSRLRSVADSAGLTVRLEDRQMDITVWAGSDFRLYVENKVTKAQATSLLLRMREYGESGFDMNAPDKGNDPLRKAKYLFCDACRPEYFALSAIDYEQLFRIEFLEGNNRFRLVEIEGPMTLPLAGLVPKSLVPPRSLSDEMEIEFKQYEEHGVWLSQGTGQTAVNVYLPGEKKDSIALGIYKDGRLWTDFKKLGHAQSLRLAANLFSLGIEIDTSKEWGFWKQNGAPFRLTGSDAEPIAAAVMAAVGIADQ